MKRVSRGGIRILACPVRDSLLMQLPIKLRRIGWLQARTRTRGGGGGGSAQKRPKEERKFRPDMSARKNSRSAQIRQN